MARDRSFQERQVEPVEALHDLGQSMVRRQVEISVDSAEYQIEVEQDGFLFLGRGE